MRLYLHKFLLKNEYWVRIEFSKQKEPRVAENDTDDTNK